MANYILLERIELNDSAASITFANIPQSGYTDLKIVASSRVAGSNVGEVVNIAFNGSSSNISARLIYGDSPSIASITSSSNGFWTVGSGATSNTFGSSELYFPNYNSSSNKSWSTDSVLEHNGGTYQLLLAGLWSQTAAINSITITPPLQSFVANSTFSLYGIAAVGTNPAISPKASGGNIVDTDGTYWIHTFNTSGTFTPLVPLTCDYLVVAGGGGGGFSSGGGGGAGGLRSTVGSTGGGGSLESAISVTAQQYTVTVGAGGAGGTVNWGTSGSNSIFSTVTSTGGGGGGYGPDKTDGYGLTGGSGGGGGGQRSAAANAGGSATSNQGYAGGASTTVNKYGSGGGGGAGAVGSVGTNTASGAGGTGVASSITGTSVSRGGGGGGGGTYSQATAGAGGTGGGGAGGFNVVGTAGTTNTGGGGGGGGHSDSGGGEKAGGAGGSGVVIIRYAV